jgi:hypothetical protein
MIDNLPLNIFINSSFGKWLVRTSPATVRTWVPNKNGLMFEPELPQTKVKKNGKSIQATGD